MNRKIFITSLLMATACGIASFSLWARQPSRRILPPASSAASYLPASDAIVVVDVDRMLNETMPAILAGDAAKLAEANAEIDKFKTKTGINPRSFDRVTIGMRYLYPSATSTRVETVAIAHGTFDPKAITNTVRDKANGKFREEQYHGATITVVTVNDRMKLLGLWTTRVNDLAVCVLDQNSVALGTVAGVRAAIDAGKDGRASAELVALATRDPNAVIGFAGNLSRQILSKLDFGDDTIAKDVNSIQQVYGAVGSTQTDVTMTVVARTETVQAAKNLGDTVEGLRQLGGIFIGRMQPPRKTLAQTALDNLKITARGNELEIRTQVAAANLAALIK